MRCLKSVYTERRDEFNRLFLKSCLIGLTSLCILFLIHNFILPRNFSVKYNLFCFGLLIFIYPLRTLLYILALWKYRSGLKINLKAHFFVFPCLFVRTKQIIPKKCYVLALIFPFISILIGLLFLSIFIPIWNSPFFLILLSVHIAISYRDFFLIKKLWQSPKESFIEDANQGISILSID